MYYIAMDLEFNQPYDFINGEKTVLVEQCPFEIIQIGAVKLDDQFRQVDTANFLVKPQIYNRIHPHVERITGLSIDSFENQVGFSEIYRRFLQFAVDKEYIFLIWGGNDIHLLFKNVIYYQLDYAPLSVQYVNVQKMASQYLGHPKGNAVGLKNAVEALKLSTEIPFHNALNDALYTAEILKVVQEGDLPVQTYLPEPERARKAIRNFDPRPLYKTVEKIYGRKLNKKEKGMLKKVYLMGKKHQFG